LPEHPTTWVPDRIERTGSTPRAVEHEHVLRAGALPHHHRDPFDRLLVAQSQALDMPLVSADPTLTAYGVVLAWD
jgi:PIN domain nuclease of toxin-antitoxin system